MAENKERHGLVATLAAGVKEMPRNASWLLGKAIGPSESSSNGASVNGVMDTVRHAGVAVRDALPGTDSVEARLQRARAAANLAQRAEQEALQAAEHARDLAEEAEETRRREDSRLEDVEKEQSDAVRRRVSDARAKADEQVAKEQHEAELDAHDVLSRERAESEGRVSEARAEAEQAQRRAEEEFERATEQLAEARSLADEAAAAATQAAQEAQAEAERIAEDARHQAAGADDAVNRAEEMQARTAKTAAAVAHTATDRNLPGTLSGLSKAELIKLAAAQGVTGRSAMSKKQLLAAIDTKKG